MSMVYTSLTCQPQRLVPTAVPVPRQPLPLDGEVSSIQKNLDILYPNTVLF